MEKRKHLVFIVIIFVLFLNLFIYGNQTKLINNIQNEKIIHIIVQDSKNKKRRIVLNKRYDTDKSNLKDFLLNTKQLNVKVEKSEYGYLLTEIAGLKQNKNQGLWLVYESKNNVRIENKDCFIFDLRRF